MALTKITGQVVDTTTDLVVGVTTVGGGVSAVDGFFSGIVTFSQGVSIGGTLTYEDVTNIDSVGIITARSDILVGSGITLSPDGHVFTTGISTISSIVSDKITLPDSSVGSINVGLGSDLQVYHDGSNSYITNTTGNVLFHVNGSYVFKTANGTETGLQVNTDGAVELYHDNSKKLETASGGVTVTGTVAATSYTGDGSALTGISVGVTTASAQVSGITTVVDISKDDIRLDVTGNVTIDTVGGEEGQSKTLRIVNSGISTVSFNSYFKFPSGGTPNLPTTSGAISLISFTVHTQGRVGVASVFLAGASVNFS